MRQVGYLLELYRDARSPKCTSKIHTENSLVNRDLIFQTVETAYTAAVFLVKRKR